MARGPTKAAPGRGVRHRRDRAGTPALPGHASGRYGVHRHSRRRRHRSRPRRCHGDPPPSARPRRGDRRRHLDRPRRPHPPAGGADDGEGPAKGRRARRATPAQPPVRSRPRAARRPGARPCHRRVRRREHVRRRRRAAVLGRGRGRAGPARVPGRQHAGRHGRPPQPAVRAVRHRVRAARRPAQPRPVETDRAPDDRCRAHREGPSRGSAPGLGTRPRRPPEPERGPVRVGDGGRARRTPRWHQRLLRTDRDPSVPRRRPEAGPPAHPPGRQALPERGSRGRRGRGRRRGAATQGRTAHQHGAATQAALRPRAAALPPGAAPRPGR